MVDPLNKIATFFPKVEPNNVNFLFNIFVDHSIA